MKETGCLITNPRYPCGYRFGASTCIIHTRDTHIAAYGNVGLSMGFPGSTASLCGAMSNIGKCVIIFVMLIGKLRGLPTHSDAITDFSFKELNYWAKKAKREAAQLKRDAKVCDSFPTFFLFPVITSNIIPSKKAKLEAAQLKCDAKKCNSFMRMTLLCVRHAHSSA